MRRWRSYVLHGGCGLLRRTWMVVLASWLLRAYSGVYSFSSSVDSSSIGIGGGVVAIVHPIHAPIPRTAMNAMKTGIAISQSRMASKAGQNIAIV